MSLTKAKLQKNAETFLAKAKEYNILTPELEEFLASNIGMAPASSMEDLHNSFQGGLIDHILKVAKYGIQIAGVLPKQLQPTKASIIKVSFLHQIGKTFLYQENDSAWQKTNQGKNYVFNNDLTSMRVGERSAYYATKYGVDLTEEEFQAIINYDKSDADKQAKWHSCTLSTIIKQANELAIIEEKGNKK